MMSTYLGSDSDDLDGFELRRFSKVPNEVPK